MACLNRSRTFAAPRPTNISTNSEPEIEKNGTCASPATALASSVLPVPGGPTSSAPRGQLGADLRVALGLVEEVDDLGQGLLGLVLAGHVLEGDAGLLLGHDLGARAPQPLAEAAEAHGGVVVAQLLLELAVHPPAEAHEDQDGQEQREQVDEHRGAAAGGHDLRAGGGAGVVQVRQQAVVTGPVGGGEVLELPVDLGRERHLAGRHVVVELLDLLVVDHGHQVGVGDARHLGLRYVGRDDGVEQHDDQDAHDHVEDHRSSLLVLVHLHRGGWSFLLLVAVCCRRLVTCRLMRASTQ